MCWFKKTDIVKLTLFLSVFLAVVSIVFSWQAVVPKDPDEPGHCYYEETGPMKKGEVKDIENACTEAYCDVDGTMLLTSCGVAMVNDKRVEPDFSKPYPECCNYPWTKQDHSDSDSDTDPDSEEYK
ncbi:unnamed protein product [Ceutorhynchus assimilis]|uniref:Single domain-containing protein n=1 Tax=Ceutorhynchus assimilis TaxID=467358 RepID=A0A9N9QKC4_9CUCU|nr:unnamed protein product [Ceutorhynchus assimilis]